MCPEINWTDTSHLPPPGKYLMECVNATTSISKAGDEYIRLSMTLVDTGDKVSDILSWSPRAAGILRRKLKALGFEGVSEVNDDDFIGKRILGHVKHGEDMNGETILEIDISAKGSQAGYELVSPHVQEAKKPDNFDFDDDIPNF